jgi:hypothetical protein
LAALQDIVRFGENVMAQSGAPVASRGARGGRGKKKPKAEHLAPPEEAYMVTQILENLPNDLDYDGWISVMYNIIGALGVSDEAFDQWLGWSEKSDKFELSYATELWERAAKDYRRETEWASGFDSLINKQFYSLEAQMAKATKGGGNVWW